MKIFRKIILLSFSILLTLGLVACSINEEDNTEELEINKQEVEEKLVELANNGGYEITYKYESSETETTSYATIGSNGGYSWYYVGDKEEGIAFEKYNNLTLYYTLKNGNWVYQYAYQYDKDSSNYNMDLTKQFSMFLQAYEFSGSLKKAKTGKVAGRECDVYTYSLATKGQIISSLTGVDAKWSYYIDKKTGICLKFEVSGDDGSSQSSANFEVVEFKENATLTGLKHPSDVYPINGEDPNLTGNWNLLKFVGLGSIAPSKEDLISNDEFHSVEYLGLGMAVYYFKVNDIDDLSDAQSYMSRYYQDVVSAIKSTSDDHKCYLGNDEDSLVEASDAMAEEELIYSFVFLYHEQYYEISFMLDDATSYIDSFVLVIEVNKVEE